MEPAQQKEQNATEPVGQEYVWNSGDPHGLLLALLPRCDVKGEPSTDCDG